MQARNIILQTAGGFLIATGRHKQKNRRLIAALTLLYNSIGKNVPAVAGRIMKSRVFRLQHTASIYHAGIY